MLYGFEILQTSRKVKGVISAASEDDARLVLAPKFGAAIDDIEIIDANMLVGIDYSGLATLEPVAA